MIAFAKTLKNSNLRSTTPYLFRFQTTRTLLLQPASESVKLQKLTDIDSGILEVNLERPGLKNAIGWDMLRGLQYTFEAVRRDHTAKVLMICSSVPKVFCAGADLKERKTMSPSEVHDFVNSLRSTFSYLEALCIPTIAVIEGTALGGGLEMALSCDFRICGEDAVLGLPETGLAIIPGLISTDRADTAYSSGPLAIQMAKRAIDEGLEVDITSGLALEEECYEEILHSKDRLEGLAAFDEKRKPNFTGQ